VLVVFAPEYFSRDAEAGLGTPDQGKIRALLGT